MKRDVLFFLKDILESIKNIKEFSKNIDEKKFLEDKMNDVMDWKKCRGEFIRKVEAGLPKKGGVLT